MGESRLVELVGRGGGCAQTRNDAGWGSTAGGTLSQSTPTRDGLLRSPLAAFLSAVVVLMGLWLLAGPNSADEISGDASYYLDLWRHPRQPTAAPFTYRVLTPWLARLTGLDAFWAF